MQTHFFRINKKEYCHITDDLVFIINSKEVSRVPLEHELDESWGVISVLNYLVFAFLFIYTAVSITYYQFDFFIYPMNYGAIILLLIAFHRVKEGFLSSKTPTIQRSTIKSVHFKTPKFSYPRLIIYFKNPQKKIVRRIIPILYKQEALPILKEKGLINN